MHVESFEAVRVTTSHAKHQFTMMQSHLIILCITSIILQVSAKGFTESKTIDLLNGRVVKVNNSLVHVSISKGSINLTSSDADFVPCQLNVDEDASAKYLLGDATSLGNGKIIVWNHGFEPKTGLTRWKIFIIDPVNCTVKTVTKVAKEGATLNKINTIIPYHDSFDIFSQSKECSPCRFKDDGVSIELPESVYKPLNLPEDYTINSVSGDNSTSGYLLVETFKNCTSLLKILSPTFEVEKEQLIDRHVESVSTDHGQIRICSSSSCLGQANITHDCQMLDSGLRSERVQERITEKEDTFLQLVQNLPDKGAIVAFVSQSGCFLGDGEGSFGDIYVRRIRADGQIDSEVKFESVLCWEYDFQNFQMPDGRYCLAAYDGVNFSEYPQKVFIKCLKYDE